jgi:Xaa-Pro aminopeptidase
MNTIYIERQVAISSRLQEGEALLIFAANHKIRNRDVEYKFRQDSDYYYLTGIEEPDGILFIDRTRRIHFCLPKDKSKEIWTGIRLGKEWIKNELSLTESFELVEWNEKKEELLTNVHTLYYFFGMDESRDREILQVCASLNRKLRDGKFGPARLEIPEFLHETRMIKTPYELKIIQEAIRITKKAHIELMKKSQVGMYEYELEAILESIYLQNGAWGGGYGHIVATGKNATVLHYTKNNCKIQENDCILVDSGAEYKYYTADVTRVFPAGKKFTASQRDAYTLVLESQKNAIQMTKAGTKFLDIHKATVRFLSDGLKQMGFFQESLDEILEKELFKKFYMHRTGHWLGMDVHDVGRYYQNQESRVLRDGQITTVEPGLYFDPEDETIPKEFRGIGIRIEDNILVNGENPINLTIEIPKEINDIESLKA